MNECIAVSIIKQRNGKPVPYGGLTISRLPRLPAVRQGGAREDSFQGGKEGAGRSRGEIEIPPDLPAYSFQYGIQINRNQTQKKQHTPK